RQNDGVGGGTNCIRSRQSNLYTQSKLKLFEFGPEVLAKLQYLQNLSKYISRLFSNQLLIAVYSIQYLVDSTQYLWFHLHWQLLYWRR
ncbi:hypothetical protein, partial [Aetokthonos hydrillicola]|uniref:hypothetical protein n=1 Tax=Aetokthonos hydrillicola TaxID=1550245 RepID=UPI0030D78A3D